MDSIQNACGFYQAGEVMDQEIVKLLQCNAFLCISLYFSPLHFFASLSPLHFVSLLVDGGPAVRLADKGGVRVIWRARRDFFLLSFEIIYCRMLYIVSHLKNFFFHN